MDAPATASERALPAYSWSMVFDAAARVRYARLNCPGCGRHDDVRTGFNLPANMIKEKFERMGWVVDIEHIRKCKCPTCKEGSRHMRETKPQSATPIALVQPAAAEPAAATPQPLTPLTPPQKAKLRSMLDAWFDDSKGYYLDGKSDAWIAKELNIPRKHVEDLRLAAYGELKAPPELVALREELQVAMTQAQQMMDKFVQLTKRLDEIERATGVSSR